MISRMQCHDVWNALYNDVLNKINEIIEFANSDSTTDDESQLENYKCYVKNLGDSYLRNTLEYLLKNRKRRN